MKLLGTALLLWGSLWVRRLLARRRRRTLAWGEEMCRMLDLLYRGMVHFRWPLPRILRGCRAESRETEDFWGTILEGLGQPFPALWRAAAAVAPPEYRPWLLPLGDSLSAGDRPDLINLTREEVYRAAEGLRRQQQERDRLETVLCLAASLMTAAVLL